MTGRTNRSQDEICRALSHITYEATMCAVAAVRCAEIQYGMREGDGDDRNAYLESTLLHARNLYEFLCTDGRKDDLRRGEFGSEWVPAEGQQREAADRLAAAREHLHKHLAHLTWERVDRPERPAWAVPNVAYCAVVLAEAWMRHVNDEDERGSSAATVMQLREITSARQALEPLGAAVTLLLRPPGSQ